MRLFRESSEVTGFTLSPLTELARDFLHRTSKFRVVRGIVSPVHDAYGKKVSTPSYRASVQCHFYLVHRVWLRHSIDLPCVNWPLKILTG